MFPACYDGTCMIHASIHSIDSAVNNIDNKSQQPFWSWYLQIIEKHETSWNGRYLLGFGGICRL